VAVAAERHANTVAHTKNDRFITTNKMTVMDQYGPAFLAIASIYVVWNIMKYMLDRCFFANQQANISQQLLEMNKRFNNLQFESVCLCRDCMKQADGRRNSIASASMKIEVPVTHEMVAIGIQDNDVA
jgi:hypothetical protein